MSLTRAHKSLTLLEVLLALSLFGIFALALASIRVFSGYQVISSQRRAAVQNEVSYCLEHITKHAQHAIGNTVIANQNPIDLAPLAMAPDQGLAVFVDAGNAGNPGDGEGNAGSPTESDHWIGYRRISAGNTASQFLFYPLIADPVLGPLGNSEVLSNRITAFVVTRTNNHINVNLTGCWNPNPALLQPVCGANENPQVNMSTTVILPRVSLN